MHKNFKTLNITLEQVEFAIENKPIERQRDLE